VAAHPFAFGAGTQSLYFAFLRLPFDAVEVRHGCPTSVAGNLLAALLNRFGPKLAALGSSDSHIPHTAGQAFTWFPGDNSRDLRRAIETRMVRPGGTTWKLANLLRALPVIAERGWPRYASAPELSRLN
jgi:hypothetical protein